MKIGLTGGLASGKSTVAGQLAAAGLEVVDADDLVARLYQAGQPGAATVADLFGTDLLDAEGNVDHRRLAARIFGDHDALRKLEQRIHPLVRNAFLDKAAGGASPIVLEATLLVEAGQAPDFDLVVTVEADPSMRLRRAVERGLTAEQAQARLSAQTDEEIRSRAADWILRNDGSLEELGERVLELVDEIRRRSAEHES